MSEKKESRFLFVKIFWTSLCVVVIAVIGINIYEKLGKKLYTSKPYERMFQRHEAPLNYSLKPNWKGEDHEVSVSSNNYGVRDNDWGKLKEDHLRILILGDSQTFGVSVAFEKIFSQVVKKEISDLGIKVDVYNAGVPGWNFEDQVHFAEQKWQMIQPHFVAILFIENDLDSSITAAPNGGLMAIKKPFEPFLRTTDSWFLQSFSLAYIKDNSLALNIANGVKESWRVEPKPNIFMYNISTTGKRAYLKYEANIDRLKNLMNTDKRIFTVVDTKEPGGRVEKEVKKSLDRHDIDNVLLSPWLGDLNYYQENWANLPIDVHGNEKYHALVGHLILQNIKNLNLPQFAELSKLEPKVPEKIEEVKYKKLVMKTKEYENDVLSNLKSSVKWSDTESLRQVISMGGEYSQSRVLLKSATPSSYIKMIPQKSEKQNMVSVWAEVNEQKMFLESFGSQDAIWAKLPQTIPANTIFEIGYVAGHNKSGIFKEIYPIKEISAHQEAPEGFSPGPQPFTTMGNISGLSTDGWMGPSMTVKLLPASQNNKFMIKIDGVSHAPKEYYPIELSAKFSSEEPPSKFLIKDFGKFTWNIKLDSKMSSFLKIISDKTFVPSKVDPKNPDSRELSILINDIEIINL